MNHSSIRRRPVVLRPSFHAAAALALAASALAGPAGAQSPYPSGPVTIVVPFGPGGVGDITARVIADGLTRELGQQVLVLNQPGAGGSLAAREALNAEPDGHTLALFSNGTAVSVPLFADLQFDPLADFVPVSSLAYFDFLFVSAAEGPIDSLADFVRLSQESPDSLSVGTINTGSTQNLSAELFKSTTGVEFTIVPYKATPDLTTGLLGGEVDLIIDSEAALRAPLSDATAVALATSGPERSRLLPDVPTAIEDGIEGFDVTSWNAIFAPAGTPSEVVARLNEAIGAVLAQPEVQARLADLGLEPRASTPEEIAQRLRDDIAKWGAVIAEAGIAQQ